MSDYTKISELAVSLGLRDPGPQFAELERLGVHGVARYAAKLERLLRSIAKTKAVASARGEKADIEEGEEEYWSLTREGAVAGWLATHGAEVTMEPRYPKRGADLSAECSGHAVNFEVKRLKIMLNPVRESRNQRVTDTVAHAHRQLMAGAPNVVVIIDRDPMREPDDIEDGLNQLAAESEIAGTLKRVSAVLYESPVAIGSEEFPSGWLFRAFNSGGLSLPECMMAIVELAFRPRDIDPKTIADWLSGSGGP